MSEVVALLGAAGKMGTRISNNLAKATAYEVLYVESAGLGEERLRTRGLTPTPLLDAVLRADIVVMAIPDVLIDSMTQTIVPQMKSGAMVLCLDPAAPYGGEILVRDDIAYFVTHPCHPSIIREDTDPAARQDFFGGVAARQAIVCALMRGSEADYVRGEALACAMFAPVARVHRITIEQMALLEPAMAETMALTLMMALREGLDEVVKRGVPEEAARDFLLGHLGIFTGILFGFYDAQVSDGAKRAAARARQLILQPDWKKVFEPEHVMREIRAITQGL
ncbi:MAG: phosphogluconate dehydrogenase C-terminal domain-containing protein [Anaerolineae bacterium]